MDKPLREALFQLLFPFSLDADCHGRMRETLAAEGFVPFRLNNLEQERAFYGPKHRVSHRRMERYYLPFTNHVLFPGEDNPESFQRLTKKLDLQATLHLAYGSEPREDRSAEAPLAGQDADAGVTGSRSLSGTCPASDSDCCPDFETCPESDSRSHSRSEARRDSEPDSRPDFESCPESDSHSRSRSEARRNPSPVSLPDAPAVPFRARFELYSVDVVFCPFDTGFITLRVGLASTNAEDGRESLGFSGAIEFADRLRMLQDSGAGDRRAWIECEGKRYDEVQDFIFQAIVPHTVNFLDRSPMDGSYFEKLPYLVDERMYVMAHYVFPENAEITLRDRYRAARLDGIDDEGRPSISASHEPYIESFCRNAGIDRWAPDTYYLANESGFCCLTRLPVREADDLADRMLGEYYYGLLLNLFHRIVLLKLSNAYSKIQVERTPDQTRMMIRAITTFSAKYDFLEVVSQSQGREIFVHLRRMYRNDELFQDVKMTLTDLYKYQENATSKRSSYLLTVLTIYTVISGIYGMNQVIEDLKGPIRWSAARSYSPFEWIALAVTLSGLIVAFALTINVLGKWVADGIRSRRRKGGF